MGRESKKGVNNLFLSTRFLKAEEEGLKLDSKEFTIRSLGKKEIRNKYKLKGEEIWRKKTIKSFIQSHPKGTYIVMVAKHALTIKDGELLDWDNNKFEPTRKVVSAYQIEQKPEVVQLSLF